MGIAQSRNDPSSDKTVKYWLNLNGNEFEEPSDQWYNLPTGRYVKNKPKYDPVYSIRGIRILGRTEDLVKFWELNLERLGQSLPKRTEFKDVIFAPFEDIAFLSRDATLRAEKCLGDRVSPVRTTDVAKLPEETLSKVCRFSFGGLFTKGRVVRVIDGDTLDLVIFVPFSILSSTREGKVGALPTKGSEKGGFFTQVRVRMYGYDSAEKNTEAGLQAKQLFEEKIDSLGGIVWCQFIDANEKYDRSLAVLYEDKEKTRLLNDFLFRQEQMTNTKMVFPYLGGTKKKF